jgi:hypothetical protein
MAISTYSQLKTAITDWMARSDVSGVAADFITLGEARLNRLLGVVGTTVNLTGVIGSSQVDISALSITEPQNLYLTEGQTEYFMTARALGTYSTTSINGRPSIWAIEGTKINFDRPLSQAYPLRFVYLGRFALSDAAPTNEFLTNNPDLYMAAAIVWGNVYTKDIPGAAMWKQILDEFTAEVAHDNSRKKRSELTIDPGLATIGRYRYNNSNGSWQ